MRRKVRILVCRGPECGEKRGSSAVYRELEARIAAGAVPDVDVTLGWQSCFGQCRRGVNVLVRPARPGEDPFFSSFLSVVGPGCALYHGVTAGDVARILDEHVAAGRVIVELKNRGG